MHINKLLKRFIWTNRVRTSCSNSRVLVRNRIISFRPDCTIISAGLDYERWIDTRYNKWEQRCWLIHSPVIGDLFIDHDMKVIFESKCDMEVGMWARMS
jgi:hypothetical protein